MEYKDIDFKAGVDLIMELRRRFRECNITNIYFDNLGYPVLQMETSSKKIKFKLSNIEEIKID